MRAPQERQRPRRTAYETSGTLSYHAISEPHAGHAERGLTSERRSGRRAATTFRKLPSASAGAKIKAASATSTPGFIGGSGAGLKPPTNLRRAVAPEAARRPRDCPAFRLERTRGRESSSSCSGPESPSSRQ